MPGVTAADRHARGELGGTGVFNAQVLWAGGHFRSCVGVDSEPKPQHVYAHRHGRRRHVSVRVAGTLFPSIFPAGFRTHEMVETY